jgi:hypothetical protein
VAEREIDIEQDGRSLGVPIGTRELKLIDEACVRLGMVPQIRQEVRQLLLGLWRTAYTDGHRDCERSHPGEGMLSTPDYGDLSAYVPPEPLVRRSMVTTCPAGIRCNGLRLTADAGLSPPHGVATRAIVLHENGTDCEHQGTFTTETQPLGPPSSRSPE